MKKKNKNSQSPTRTITMRSISSLHPYSRNARTHSEKQIDQIADSLREFGWTNPVLIDADGTIVAGHARVLAAQKLGMKEAPTICLDGLSPAQIKAYVIADNKLALNAGWDEELLHLELTELKELDFALELTGFDAQILDRMGEKLNTDAQLIETKWQLLVDCSDEMHQIALMRRLEDEGYQCRPLIS